MANERDYILNIGAKLNDKDVEAINNAIKTSMKDVTVKIKSNTTEAEAGVKRVVKANKDASTSSEADAAKAAAAQQRRSADIARETKKQVIAEQQLAAQKQKALDSQAAAEQRLAANNAKIAQQQKAALEAELSLDRQITAEIQRRTQLQNELLERNAFNRGMNDSFSRPVASSSAGLNVDEMQRRGLREIDQRAEGVAEGWKQLAPSLMTGAAAFDEVNKRLPPTLKNMTSLADQMGNHIRTFAEWSLAAKSVEAVSEGFGKGFTDAVHMDKEQNITGQYYDAAAGKAGAYTPAMSNEAQNAAINMARVYGEEVTHVTENVGLWAKVTHGQLEPAIGLTNAAMKLNAVSGMNMEEIFRSSIATLGQLQEPLSRVNYLYDVAIGLALRYGGGIQSLGGESQDAAAQMMKGMDALSAVMGAVYGNGKRAIAQTGALVAVATQLSSSSGEDVGKHLASAFAGIESSKGVKVLKDMGIEVYNNNNLLADMKKHWGEIEEKMVGSVIRKQDVDVFKSVVDNAGMVNKAATGNYDRSAQKAFDTLQQTTDMQLKQLRAGWEAVSLSVMREFLPAMNQAAAVGTNTVIPFMLANKKSFADLIGEIGTAGLAYVGFQGFIMAGGTAIKVWQTISSLSVKKMSDDTRLYMAAASGSLASHQVEALKLLSTTGQVDADMEMNVKLLAQRYNISIDAMIIKMREMQIEAGLMEAGVASSLGIIGDAEAGLAARTGIEVGVIKTEFNGLATSAAMSARAIGAAFMSAIPIIGTVISVGMLAWDVASQAKTAHDQADDNLMRTDPNARHIRIQQEKAELANAQYEFTQSRNKSAIVVEGVEVPGSSREDQLQNIKRYQDDIAKLRGYGQAGKSGTKEDQERALLAANLKQIEAEMNAIKVPPIMVGDSGSQSPTGGADTGKAKGIASDAKQQGLAIRDLVTDYDDLMKALAEVNEAYNTKIRGDERLISIYGDQGKLLKPLMADLKAKQQVDQVDIVQSNNRIAALNTELSLLQRKAAVAAADTKHGGKTSDTYVAFEEEIDTVKGKIADAHKEVQGFKDDIEDMGQKGLEALAKLDEYKFRPRIKDAMSDYTSANKTLSEAKTVDAATSARQAYNETVATTLKLLQGMEAEIDRTAGKYGLTKDFQALRDNIASQIDTVNGGDSSRQQDLAGAREKIKADNTELALSNIAPFDKPVQEAIKASYELVEEYNKRLIALKQDGGTNGDVQALNYWEAQKQQIIDNTFALAEYDAAVKKFQASIGYQVISTAINDVGSDLATSLYDGLNPNTKERDQGQLQAYGDRTQQLQWEASQLKGIQYLGERFTIERQIQQIHIQEQALRDRENRKPSMLKSLGQSIEKSVIDDTVKKYQQSLTQSVVNLFVPPVKDALSQQNDAMAATQKSFTDIIAQGREDSMYGNVQTLAGIISTNSDSFYNSVQAMLGMSGGTASGDAISAQVDTPSFSPTNFTSLLSSNGGLGALAAGLGGTAAVASGLKQIGHVTANTSWLNSQDVPDGTYGANDGSSWGNSQDVPYGNYGSAAKSAGLGNYLTNATKGYGIGDMAASLTGGNTGNGGIGGALGGLLGTALHANPLIGTGIDVATGLIGSLFGNHFSAADEPDISNTQTYGQFTANMQGQTTTANGQSFSFDPAISTLTGGLSEGQYIAKYLSGKSATQLSSVFGSDSSAITSMFSNFTGLSNGKNGNFDLNGSTYNWQQIENLGTEAFNQIVQASQTLNQSLAPLISVNAYGTSGAAFSPYYTPGYGDVSSLYQTPYNSNVPGAIQPITANSYVAPPTAASTVVHTSLLLDGRTVAQTTSNYRSQRVQQGFAADS